MLFKFFKVQPSVTFVILVSYLLTFVILVSYQFSQSNGLNASILFEVWCLHLSCSLFYMFLACIANNFKTLYTIPKSPPWLEWNYDEFCSQKSINDISKMKKQVQLLNI
jgi:hypothetical protein